MQHKVYTLLFLILIYNKTLCNKIEIKSTHQLTIKDFFLRIERKRNGYFL